MDKRKRVKKLDWKAVLSLVLIFARTGTALDNFLERDRMTIGLDKHDVSIYVEKKTTFLHVRMDHKHISDGLVMLGKGVVEFEKRFTDKL